MADNTLTLYVDTLPVGAVILWFGMRNQRPAGWEICDGKTTIKLVQPGSDGIPESVYVPNLTDRFAKGASSDAQLGQQGGGTATLSVKNLPAHNHTATFGDVPAATAKTQLMAAVAYNRQIEVKEGAVNMYDRGGSGGNAVQLGDALKQIPLTVGNTGEGTPMDIMPRYAELYYIIRVR